MILEFDSLELQFGLRTVLSNVAITCRQGTVVGLLGRNGSGKSCLMKIVFGTMTASHQSIRIDGESLPHGHLAHRRIAYLPQENLIPSFLRIREALRHYGIDEDEILTVFPEAGSFMALKPSQVSGGHLRMIETMMILCSPADFCLLDEPFTGLMPLHMERIKRIIAETKRSKGIIITDHLHRHVTEISDRLYLLANGQTYKIEAQRELERRGYLAGYE